MSLDSLLHERRRVIGVLYAEDFGAEPEAEDIPPEQDVPEPEVIEPFFTLAELEAAREEGRVAGQAEAERGVAASRLHVLKRIAASLAEADAEAAAMAEAAASGMARAMLSALATCLPALCEQHGTAEVQALVRIVLPNLAEQPRVTVRVHPQMAPAIAAELAVQDSEFGERVALLPSDTIAPGDARITWENGAALRDAGRAYAAVNESLAALGLFEEDLIDAR